MAKPKTVVWELDPHTKAKHQILRTYLGAWFGILAQRMPRIVYFDGFAGPGKYSRGEDGSPIIALDIAINQAQKTPNTEFILFFVEQEQARLNNLIAEIQQKAIPNTVSVYPIQSNFERAAQALFDSLKSRGANLAPTFAFIDPFGFSGIPFRLVSKFLQYQSTEVFINVMADAINRFVEHPNQAIPQHVIDTFGTPKVIDVLRNAPDRFSALRDLYQSQLKLHARYVRYFEMRDERNKVIYYLFFASNNRLGHKKIKEAFWKVDAFGGYQFSDKTNPNQLVLFSPDPSCDIAQLLYQKFSGQTVKTEEIFTFINNDSAYIESHAKKALQILEREQKIKVNPQKSNGEKRIAGRFPEGVIITFIV